MVVANPIAHWHKGRIAHGDVRGGSNTINQLGAAEECAAYGSTNEFASDFLHC